MNGAEAFGAILGPVLISRATDPEYEAVRPVGNPGVLRHRYAAVVFVAAPI